MNKKICIKCKKEKPKDKFDFYITESGRRKERNVCYKCRSDAVINRNRERNKRKCSLCKVEKQPFDFVRNNSKDFKAYGKICRTCAYKRNLELRKPKKKKKKRTQKNKNNEYLVRYRKTKKWMINLKNNKCEICKQDFPWYAYDFHHKDSKNKDKKISRYVRCSIKFLKILDEFWEEFNRCILVCAICHRKLHIKEE